MLVAFAPIVMFLCGVANVIVPSKVLMTSVAVFIVIPLAAGWLTRTALLKSHGREWFNLKFLPKFHPVMMGALLLTLALIFAFQAENLTKRWFAVLLIAVPIVIQVYSLPRTPVGGAPRITPAPRSSTNSANAIGR
jgi:ACR3 family arsenite transporter